MAYNTWGTSFGTAWALSWTRAAGPTPPPTVTVSGAPHRLLRRFSAQINGKTYYFDSLADLHTVLNSFKTKQKKKIAKRVTRKVIELDIPRIEPPVHVPMWAVREIQQVNASLEAYYWQCLEAMNNDDEEDAIIALYG